MTRNADNQTTELREKLTERGVEYMTNDHMCAYETSWNGFTAMQLTPGAKLLMVFTPEQAIAATLGSDNEYEAKMDALLCRLTNGKWSKSYAYSLDFMVSCIDEEYETLYAKELAELGSGTCELEQLSALDVTLNMLDSIEWGACSECGCAVPMDAKFCNECGKAVTR